MPDHIAFVHLSDIHFRSASDEPAILDRDADLRNELAIDASSLCQNLGGADHVLVTGDIAFSGKVDQYVRAVEWLSSFCDRVACPQEQVWTVPGNHDVDRDVVTGSEQLQLSHAELRRQHPNALDNRLQRMLSDSAMRAALFLPLQAYNDFAARYSTAVGPEDPFWEEDIPLNDGSTLRLHGLNSVLISDDHDDDASGRLVLGSWQARFTRQEGVAYLTLAHHPPSWLLDQDEVETVLGSRVAVQLFGHKHAQRLNQIDNALRLTAGALHPDRREPNWIPRYNVFTVRVEASGDERQLEVRVYPRVWSAEYGRFVADRDPAGNDERLFRLPIGPWNGVGAMIAQVGDTTPPETRSVGEMPQTSSIPATPSRRASPAKRLTFRYLSLPFPQRVEIAQRLALWRDEERHLPDGELFRLVFRRASQNHQLAALWAAVEESYPAGDVPDNPFMTADR